ncbi:hypothetical protein BJX96DRAFT_144343 [Aspergillus floccosus]
MARRTRIKGERDQDIRSKALREFCGITQSACQLQGNGDVTAVRSNRSCFCCFNEKPCSGCLVWIVHSVLLFQRVWAILCTD